MEIKVIAIRAGEDILAKLEALLGAKIVEAPALPAVEADEPEVTEPVVPFGTQTAFDENEYRFKYVFSVKDATDLDVVVVPTGVRVTGATVDEEGRGTGFNKTLAPNGAFDQVTADFDAWDNTLTVRLFKVPNDGAPVEINGWTEEEDFEDQCGCPECEAERE